MWVSEKVLRNGKPIARSGRKATDLSEMAGLPKSNLFHGNHLMRGCAGMVLAETIMQHHSDYQSGPIGPALLGSSGRNWNHLGRDSQPDARPEIIAIQKCRADLQAFLQRTRTRLARIADSASETCEDHLEQAENSRIFRGADGSQPLKPLPILAPSLKQNVQTGAKNQHQVDSKQPASDEQPMVVRDAQFEPFAASHEYGQGTVVSGQSGTQSTKAEGACCEHSNALDHDWKVANAFDRYSYYGPAEFGHMPDERDCCISKRRGANTSYQQVDAPQHSTPPLKFGTRHVQDGHQCISSRLHLANQLRQN